MKRILLASVFSLFCIQANATNIEKLDVNCDTVALSVGNSDGHAFYAMVRWDEPASFPNPTKKVVVGSKDEFEQVGFEFQCPELYAKYDGNKLTVKSDTVQDALDSLTNKYERNFDLYFYGWYAYPSIRKGYYSTEYSINLYDYSLKSGYKQVREGQELTGYDFRDINSDVVIGYKVDGSKIKPMVYDQKVGLYVEDMVNANTIDIYHKYDDKKYNRPEKLQRIHIDKSKGLVEFYKKYPFPSS